MDIEETDKEYLVKAELPEVKKEDVKVTLEEGVLTFTVPRDVDEKKILAEFKEGVLTVHVPKAEIFKPKQIEVKVA